MNTPSPPLSAVAIEIELSQSPETVWRALTEPLLLAAWLLPNDMRAEPGARFSFRGPPKEGRGLKEGRGVSETQSGSELGSAAAGSSKERVDCEVLEAKRPALLRYTWRAVGSVDDEQLPSSILTFELLPRTDGGTLLRLTHVPIAASLGHRRQALRRNEASRRARRLHGARTCRTLSRRVA